ncbi:hypothetical protein EDC01DRAFT_634562 [Geopyxis carbonaria]|nr:hypothetical protein EDC01DRAFT_634562 [Geopyxis carbonaria]
MSEVTSPDTMSITKSPSEEVQPISADTTIESQDLLENPPAEQPQLVYPEQPQPTTANMTRTTNAIPEVSVNNTTPIPPEANPQESPAQPGAIDPAQNSAPEDRSSPPSAVAIEVAAISARLREIRRIDEALREEKRRLHKRLDRVHQLEAKRRRTSEEDSELETRLAQRINELAGQPPKCLSGQEMEDMIVERATAKNQKRLAELELEEKRKRRFREKDSESQSEKDLLAWEWEEREKKRYWDAPKW